MTQGAPFSNAAFWSEVDDSLGRADSIVEREEERARYGVMYAGNAEQAMVWYDEESEMLSHDLGWTLRRLRMNVLLCASVLGADAFVDAFHAEWATFKEPTRIVELPGIGVLHCPALDFLRDTLKTLSAFFPNPKQNAPKDDNYGLLVRILQNTGKILEDRKIVPSREQDVRDAAYSTLLHVFPDTVREVPIAQVSKVYKPDIGIRSLKTAVEFKFAQSEADLRVQIGGVYEDLKGYAGSADWTTFVAVFYAAGHWLTPQQIQAEWKLVDVPHNWEPILVFAPAKQVPKVPKKRATAGAVVAASASGMPAASPGSGE